MEMNSRQQRALGEFVESGALAVMVGGLSAEWEFDVVEAARAGDAKSMRLAALRLVSLADFRVQVSDFERQGVIGEVIRGDGGVDLLEVARP